LIVKIEDGFDVACPIGRVYEEINNIAEIGYCIAGVKEVTVISEDESDWRIEARAGFMADGARGVMRAFDVGLVAPCAGRRVRRPYR
jgi:carbon monoxide dehydrogenase subunit G